MKLNEILNSFQSAKDNQNELISDRVEKMSDEKEKLDDMVKALKTKLHNSVSKTERDLLSKQISVCQNRKAVLNDRISKERLKKI